MTNLDDAFQRMDSMYRYQRFFYDATRKFYLLGRDRLIERMNIEPDQTVAEIGCGTGRNLVILAGRYPESRFFGLDASAEMLRTADANIKKAGLTNVTLKSALAEDLDHHRTFGLDKPLDLVFFSYSITMIPTWKSSIEQAINNLKAGGMMYIVDFYDQQGLPRWFRAMLTAWLRQFHVRFWDDLIPFLYDLDQSGIGRLEISSILRRYAFIASFRKTHFLTKA